MALRTTRMEFQEMPESKGIPSTKKIRKLVQEAVRDYQDLKDKYKVYPRKMYSMIPIPLFDRGDGVSLVGSEIVDDEGFVDWLRKEKHTGAQNEVFCISRDGQTNVLCVDFHNTWAVRNWYRGTEEQKRLKSEELRSFLEEM